MTEKALDIKPETTMITKADVRKYLCEKATDKEIDLFLITCNLHGLNPLKREAYLIKYGSSPAQTVVGYETYLKRAEATGQLDGWECTASDTSATIIIYRKDRAYPFKWTIERKEFDKNVAMWNTMPRHMLKKTVISVGFRLCFPETLGGMPYTKEEMEGSGEGAKELETPPRAPEKAPSEPPEPRSQETNPPVPIHEETPSDELFRRQNLLDELPGLIDASEYTKANMAKPLKEFTTRELELFKNHVLTLIPEDMKDGET